MSVLFYIDARGLCRGIISLALLAGISGCVHRGVIVADGEKIENKGLYRFAAPGGEWKMRGGAEAWRGAIGGTLRDIYFIGCPGPKIISVMSARYEPPPYPTKRFELVDRSSFERVALEYWDQLHITLGIKRELLSHRRMDLNGYEATEIIYKTEEMSLESCESETKKMLTVMNKYVVVKRGDWGHSYLSRRAKWPAMIVLWYGSPIESFEGGVGEFDRMVEGFQFVKEQ